METYQLTSALFFVLGMVLYNIMKKMSKENKDLKKSIHNMKTSEKNKYDLAEFQTSKAIIDAIISVSTKNYINKVIGQKGKSDLIIDNEFIQSIIENSSEQVFYTLSPTTQDIFNKYIIFNKYLADQIISEFNNYINKIDVTKIYRQE